MGTVTIIEDALMIVMSAIMLFYKYLNLLVMEYIPALKFHWLTNIYDWLIGNFMPEKQFKSTIYL